MPYTNIHWIKLEKRLLNDHRFYAMSEDSQLIYMKLLMLAAETKNKVPKNASILKAALRSQQDEGRIMECMNEIKSNFPKFSETKDFYKFNGWGVRHNWVVDKELRGSSPGTRKGAVDKNRIEENREDKIKKEYITKITENFVSLKNWDRSSICNSDWTRIQKGARDLMVRTNRDMDKAMEAVNWVANQNYADWTMETVIRKYPDFEKTYLGPEAREVLKSLE